MATRCNILIQNGETRLWLYRHWDGYPAETGADIATKLAAAGSSADKFTRAMLTETRGDDWQMDRPQYEVTTGRHGDIEWLYVIAFDRNGRPPLLTWGHIPISDDKIETAAANGILYGRLRPLDEFVEAVNDDRRRTNERMDAMGPDYAAEKFGRYAMLVRAGNQVAAGGCRMNADNTTPRPWRIVPNKHTGDLNIRAANGHRVAILTLEPVADNARLIIRAVNSHDAMREALRTAESALDFLPILNEESRAVADAAFEAIAAALAMAEQEATP